MDRYITCAEKTAAERTVEVGHARAVVRPHDHRKGYVVEKVWVDPEHRGNGAARRLMREISDKFRRHDLWLKPRPYSEMGAELGATIDQLKRFYRSLGFEPADEKDNMLRPASREKQAAIVAPIALKNMRLGAQLDDALKPYQDDARTFLRSLDDAHDARERAKAGEKVAELYRYAAWKQAELAEDGEHKLQGHIDFQGLDIAVENRKGSVRSGKKPDGGTWRTVMKAPYGYVEAPAKGKDGESVDVYVGPKKDADIAYVVHQHKPDGTGHDEDKVILGTESEEEAKRLYLQHYDDPKFLGPVSAVPVDRLKQLLEQKKRLTKISGVGMGAVAAPFKAMASGGFNPAKNVQSLAQRWKPPKVSAPSVQSLPGMPKLK